MCQNCPLVSTLINKISNLNYSTSSYLFYVILLVVLHET